MSDTKFSTFAAAFGRLCHLMTSFQCRSTRIMFKKLIKLNKWKLSESRKRTFHDFSEWLKRNFFSQTFFCLPAVVIEILSHLISFKINKISSMNKHILFNFSGNPSIHPTSLSVRKADARRKKHGHEHVTCWRSKLTDTHPSRSF